MPVQYAVLEANAKLMAEMNFASRLFQNVDVISHINSDSTLLTMF